MENSKLKDDQFIFNSLNQFKYHNYEHKSYLKSNKII